MVFDNDLRNIFGKRMNTHNNANIKLLYIIIVQLAKYKPSLHLAKYVQLIDLPNDSND